MKKQTLSKSALLLKDVYQIYAKMLAVENIQVVFDEAIDAPAKFDLLNRILYISPVHSTQAELIPGLVIHEVGHALFSLLTEEEAKKLKRITKLLNIIDDGYQERKTCQRYANAKKHLLKVFDEFFLKIGDDCFNTENKLINIVNILNYNCKGFKHGYSKEYPTYVLPEDLKLLREGEMINLPTLMERNDFAIELAKALKKYGEMTDDSDIDLDSSSGGEDKNESDGEDESNSGEGSGSGNGDSDENAVEKILEDNESKLNDHHKKFQQKLGQNKSYELPNGKELLEICDAVDLYVKDGTVDESLKQTKNLTLVDKFTKCQKEAKKIAGRIFTKFNMRVQASNYADTQYQRSGTLDPERCALYQVYDDIFQKIAVDQNQSNHAYSIMLDWSGSMNNSVYSLTLRIMELVYFAKMANIEIEVWLYTTGYAAKVGTLNKNLALMKSKFIKIVNTKKHNTVETEQRLKHLWVLSNQLTHNQSPKLIGSENDPFFQSNGLGGTNVLEGLILGHHVLSQMQADIKTCFLLSDGEDTDGFDLYYSATDKKQDHSCPQKKIYVGGMDVDQLYNHQSTRLNATAAIAEVYRAAGQRTTGLAWNCLGSDLKKYCNNVINCHVPSTKEYYIHGTNLFIDEIVKNLL